MSIAAAADQKLLLPGVAEAARRALPAAGGADGLALALEEAVRAERAAIQATLAELVLARLRASHETACPGEAEDEDLAAARLNARVIAEEVMGEEGFFAKLARWVAVNVCFWLWEGDSLDSIDGESVGALVRVYAESSAQVIADMLSPPHKPIASLKEILGIGRSAGTPLTVGELPRGMMMMLSAGHVQALREALYKNSFRQVEGSPWPTAVLDQRHPAEVAQLRPPALDDYPALPQEHAAAWAQTMWRQQRQLCDRDADALDALCAIYMSQARGPNEAAIADVDQLLAMRGLKPKRGGAGRRGGYEPEQRQDMQEALAHIQNLWITVAEVEVEPGKGRRGRHAGETATKTLQSRPFIITDRMGETRLDGSMDVERFVFRPGKAFAAFMFGDSRQTALLFQKALQYDPYRKRWEKRLTRYLCWQWRGLAGTAETAQRYPVGVLMEAVGEPVDERYPGKTRSRLEKALDTLMADGILGAWRYASAGWDDGHRKWLPAWLATDILVEVPEPVREFYGRLSDGDLGSRLRHCRRRLGMRQTELARALGIQQGHLSKVESARVLPSPQLRQAIEDWLAARDHPSAALIPST